VHELVFNMCDRYICLLPVKKRFKYKIILYKIERKNHKILIYKPSKRSAFWAGNRPRVGAIVGAEMVSRYGVLYYMMNMLGIRSIVGLTDD
jgi:hypothetical protein